MFAFEEWHSALEMKLYLHRFISPCGRSARLLRPEVHALQPVLNHWLLPLQRHLEALGVKFQFDTEVTDIAFDISPERKQATELIWTQGGQAGGIKLSADDLVFTTIGSLVDNSDEGDHHTPAKLNEGPALPGNFGNGWLPNARISVGQKCFAPTLRKASGNQQRPRHWTHAFLPTSKKICQRSPFSGKVVTGGIVTARDSAWLMSWTVNWQPHFKAQPKDQIVAWIYGLFADLPGDYVKSPCKPAQAKKLPKNGFTTWAYLKAILPNWPPQA